MKKCHFGKSVPLPTYIEELIPENDPEVHISYHYLYIPCIGQGPFITVVLFLKRIFAL